MNNLALCSTNFNRVLKIVCIQVKIDYLCANGITLRVLPGVPQVRLYVPNVSGRIVNIFNGKKRNVLTSKPLNSKLLTPTRFHKIIKHNI